MSDRTQICTKNTARMAGWIAAACLLIAGITPLASGATIAYWRFEPGSFTVDSAHGHTLTNTNATSSGVVPPGFSNGSTGSASFNGTNAFMLSDVINLNGLTAVTVEWFMKVTSATTGVQLPFEQSANGNLSVSQADPARHGTFTSVLDNGSTLADLDLVHFSSSSNDHEHFAASLTAWHHYAMVMQQVAIPTTSGSTAVKLELYIDGVLQSATSTPGASLQQATFANEVLYIGARGDTNANGVANDPGLFYNGLIDELRISSGALTPDQFIIAPEPASLGLLLGAGTLLLRRRGAR